MSSIRLQWIESRFTCSFAGFSASVLMARWNFTIVSCCTKAEKPAILRALSVHAYIVQAM